MGQYKFGTAGQWKTSVLSIFWGGVVAAIFLQYQRNLNLQIWQLAHEVDAKSDLRAACELLRLEELTQEQIRKTLQRFAMDGEFESLTSLGQRPSIDKLDSTTSAIRWSKEAGGYMRLHCSIPNDSAPENLLSLTRRFGPDTLPRLSIVHWVTASALWVGTLLLSSLFLRNKDRLKQLGIQTQEWFRQLENQTTSASSTLKSLQLTDHEIGHNLEKVFELYEHRIAIGQSAAEQSTRIMLTMQIGVLAFDSSMRLLFVNRAGAELLSLDPYASQGKLLVELLRQPTIVDLIQRVHQQSCPLDADLDLPLKSTTLRLRAAPLHEHLNLVGASPTPNVELKNGVEGSGVLLTVTDETRLRQLENMRRDFTANVSHELKTPLSAIKAYAETLLMGAIDEEDAKRHFVERINEQAHRLDILIRDLLQLTRIQSQPESPSVEILRLDDVIQSCVNEHRTIGLSRNITLDTSNVLTGCSVRSHLDSLRTIIDNLLSNAIRYNRDGGWVRLRTIVNEELVTLAVEDSGIGIPPEDLHRIFERFYRVEKARDQDTGGTGLGLSIVKHLAQSLSIPLHVQSELGRGSTFTLTLPRAEAQS